MSIDLPEIPFKLSHLATFQSIIETGSFIAAAESM